MKPSWRTCAVPAFAALAFLAVANKPLSAYAHFLHYGPKGEPIPEKYNLQQLPQQTVTFFVSDDGPDSYAGNDSFPSVLNQVRQAASAWNGVSTSALRVAFGGLYSEGTADNSPGGLVVFEDLPPGVLAYSGPTTCEDISPDGPASCQRQMPFDGDTFLPILRSTMHLSRNLTQLPGPSFSETFFLVTTHEMGHALGLQHTYASSTMSTIATRSTSLSNPLDADDRAGISDLYPAAAFSTQFGSLSGKVTYSDDGSAVHMASVVAVASGLPAVSALTLPDGTFQINGVAPGRYYLYVHPLPPAQSADIQAPEDANGNPVNPTRPFNAVLFPGVTSASSARTTTVTAGENSGGRNLVVQPRADVPIYDVSLYSYFSPSPDVLNAAHPAYVSQDATYGSVVASGPGIVNGGGLASGLQIQTLSGKASVYATLPYSDDDGNTFVAVYSLFTGSGAAGPQHLLFSTPGYLYLLPSAFHVTSSGPPALASAAPNEDGTVTVAGAGFTSGTQLYFDALPASSATIDSTNGFITATPPVGASGQVATLTIYNTDGQNSSFLQSGDGVTYAYPASDAPAVSAAPMSLPAGAEAAIEIHGANTHFASGHTAFGFGTHDVVVQQTFILSPTHAFVDVWSPEGAAQVTSGLSALSDFELAVAPGSLQIGAPKAGLPSPYPVLFNGVAGESGSFPGAIVSLYGVNLQSSADATPTVTIAGKKASLLYASPTLINLRIPGDLPAGATPLMVNSGSMDGYPVMVRIDPAEPLIVALKSNGDPVKSAEIGASVDVLLTGFADAGASIDPSRAQVSVGGVLVPAVAVSQLSQSATFDVQFTLTNSVQPGSNLPLIVYLDGRSSVSTSLTVSASSSEPGS